MPYTLLYSRSIASDDKVRFTDVSVTESSIMVDILSLRSPFYRVAGYLYAIVSDGVSDYERSGGFTVPYGKNRLVFPSATLPYYLEFFPKWGTKQAIISVYTGMPSSPPPSNEWRTAPGLDREFKLFANPAGIQTREISNQQGLFDAAEGATQGHIYQGYLYWLMPDMTRFKREIGTWNPVFLVPTDEYQATRSSSSSVVL